MIEYNSCIYQPTGWGRACRFVAMRILKEQKQPSKQPYSVCFLKTIITHTGFSVRILLEKPMMSLPNTTSGPMFENLVGEAKA